MIPRRLSLAAAIGVVAVTLGTSAALALGSPVPLTGPADGVSEFSATITATVNPNAHLTTYWFQYSTADTAGCPAQPEPSPSCTTSPVSSAGRGETPVAVSTQLLGLTPGTTYHFRVVAEGPLGASYGEDMTFTTEPYPLPTITAGEPQELTQTSAVLTATIDPHAQQTAYQFEIGATTAYGTTVPSSIPPSEPQTVRLGLANLVPGTAYHYRVLATNLGGTTVGEDHAFTTAPPLFPTALPPSQGVTAPVESPPPVKVIEKPKLPSLTNAQKLATALKACRKGRGKRKRVACETQAHRKYGPAKKAERK
jgi:hypothetical protein